VSHAVRDMAIHFANAAPKVGAAGKRRANSRRCRELRENQAAHFHFAAINARGALSTKRPGPSGATDAGERTCAVCGTKRSAVHFVPAERARDGGHLSRPCAREMLEPVEHDFSSQPMPLDVEQSGSV
jgi:hypothetical protein